VADGAVPDRDTPDVLAGMDTPRPLAPELRARLEERLLASSALPLGSELDARLAQRMTDPVAAVLEGLDAPRPLAPGQRATVSRSLRRRGRGRTWLAGAAAAALVAGALALTAGRDHPATTAAQPQTGTSATASATASSRAPARNQQGGAEQGATAPTTSVARPAAGGGAPMADSVAGLRVTPDHGPAAGSTLVRLSGADLATTSAVEFGTATAPDLVVHSDGTVTVHSPAGVPGLVVDVTAVLRDGRRVVAPGGFRYR
jgi:hypothetical protein